MHTDVLIVGGGPTGLMMGSLLRRAGVNCRLIDEGLEEARESRAIGIQARSMELFQKMGIVEKFIEKGLVGSGAKVFLNGRQRVSLDFKNIGRDDTPFPFVFFIPQSETEKILIEDLKQHHLEVERGTTLHNFHQDQNKVIAYVSRQDGSQEAIISDYIVGCDGSHSQVRKILNVPFVGDSYDCEFIMADTKIDWDLDNDKLMVFLDPGALGVHFPLKRDESRILTIRDHAEVTNDEATTSYPATLPEIEEQFKEATHRDLKLHDAEWVTRFHVHHRCVTEMRKDRAFVVGDAAHIHSPVGAQGMNTGFQDAANLAWKLALVVKHKSKPEILDTYHSERWPVAQKLVHTTDRIFQFVTSRKRSFILARDTFLPIFAKILMSVKKGREFLFSFVSQLNIHYHPSSIVGLNAGQRMPNFDTAGGREIFDLIKGYKFHLLVFGNNNYHDRLTGVKVHHLPPSLFKSEGFVLVRPDGYIAYQSNDLSENSLVEMEKYLQLSGIQHEF